MLLYCNVDNALRRLQSAIHMLLQVPELLPVRVNCIIILGSYLINRGSLITNWKDPIGYDNILPLFTHPSFGRSEVDVARVLLKGTSEMLTP